MAIAFSLLTSGSEDTDNTTFTTASVTPTSGAVVFIAVMNFENSTTQPAIGSISGNGLTWTIVREQNVDAAGGDRATVHLWKGLGTPSSGTITVTWAGGATIRRPSWSVFEATGADTTTPIVQNNGDTSGGSVTTLTTTLAAFADATNNACICIYGVQNNTDSAYITPHTGHTELSEAWISYSHHAVSYLIGEDTSVGGGSWLSGRSGQIAVELAVAAGTPTITCQVITASSTVFNPTIVVPIIVCPVITVSSTIFSPSVDDNTANLPALITSTGIEPESVSYNPVIIDSNGNLYRILESQLAANNQPRAMKSTDGGETWTEQDAANRPGTDTGSIGDLESGWTTWDATDKLLTFTWMRSYYVYSSFRTSDHATNPDTWVSNTREEISADTSSPQFGSHTSPTDQAYQWMFWDNGTNPKYRSRTNSTTYGAETAIDTAGTAPAAILDSNNISHIIYNKTSQIHLKKLTSGGTLDSTSTRIDTNGTNAVAIPYAAPQVYVSGSDTYVGVLFTNTTSDVKFVLVTNGTPGSEETITTDDVVIDPGTTGNQGIVASLAFDEDNQIFHAVWSDLTTDDVMHSERPLAGAWTTPDVLQTPTFEPAWVYCKVNERPNGTRFLSYTYSQANSDDQNDCYYAELALAAAGLSIVCPVITVSSTLFNPTVTTLNTIEFNVLAAASTVLSPSVVHKLLVDVIAVPSTVFTPSTVAKIELPVINATTTLFNTSVLHRPTVDFQSITTSSTIPSPTVNQDIALNVINSSTTVFNPELSYDVVLPVLNAPETVLQPATDTSVNVESLAITTTSTIFSPTLDQDISLDVYNAPATVPNPEVASAGAEQDISLVVIDAASTVLNPSVTTLTTVEAQILESPSTVLSPSLKYDVVLPVVTTVSTIFSPSLEQIVQMQLVNTAPTVYAPRIGEEVDDGFSGAIIDRPGFPPFPIGIR